jgi:flagellar basal-body rod protein FlgF
MAQGTYIAMSGMAASAEQLERVANNLANAETPGYKADRIAFQAFLPPGSSGGTAHVAAVSAGIDQRPGTLRVTDNPLDLVPEGDAYFAVAMPSGLTAYTRDGRLSVDQDGRLQTPGGLLLDQQGRPIQVGPTVSPTVSPTGSVLVGGLEVARLGLYTMQGTVERLAPSIVRPSAGTQVTSSEGGVLVGQLELGNVNAIDSLVALLSAQRSFDTSVQAIETYKKLGQAATEVGKVK